MMTHIYTPAFTAARSEILLRTEILLHQSAS